MAAHPETLSIWLWARIGAGAYEGGAGFSNELKETHGTV